MADELPQVNADESGLSPRRAGDPPIGSVTYPSIRKGLAVSDFLDPSKPLVKSTVSLTRPKGPRFVEDEELEKRRQARNERKILNSMNTGKINGQRLNERKYLKAQYEFEREKRLAERTIYAKEKSGEWQQRLANSPFLVDLVADNERIEEEMFIRESEEKRRRRIAERKKKKIKNEIIVKALSEVPLLEEARRQKKQLFEDEKREKALRDVQRVESIQDKKIKDTDALVLERQAKLDQRIMASGMAKQ